MIGDFLEYLRSATKRAVNGNYRRRSVVVIARCRSLVLYINATGEDKVDNMEEIRKAFEAATAAIKCASANPPKLHEDVVRSFAYAEACLLACTQPLEQIQDPNCKNVWKDVNDARERNKSPFDVLKADLKVLLTSQAVVPATSSAAGGSGSTNLPLASVRQLTLLAAPSGSAFTPPADTNTAPAPSASATQAESTSALPSSDTPVTTATLSVEVIVYDSDLEHPQGRRKYEVEAAGGNVAVLMWMVTNPTGQRDQLTPLRDHTRWYIREVGRHAHTISGLAFSRLVADQPLRDIPLQDGVGTVCVVQSDKPYMVLTVGRERSTTGASMMQSDQGVLLQDYIDDPLARALSPSHWVSRSMCEYHNRLIHATHSIAASDTKKWRDLPRDHVRDYSADWLVVLSELTTK